MFGRLGKHPEPPSAIRMRTVDGNDLAKILLNAFSLIATHGVLKILRFAMAIVAAIVGDRGLFPTLLVAFVRLLITSATPAFLNGLALGLPCCNEARGRLLRLFTMVRSRKTRLAICVCRGTRVLKQAKRIQLQYASREGGWKQSCTTRNSDLEVPRKS